MENHEGLVQGSPISSSGFSFTVHHRVKEAGRRLTVLGGCARFGMDDGYMIGPPEEVLKMLAEFAAGINEDCGCELNIKKCKMFSNEEGASEAARRAGHIDPGRDAAPSRRCAHQRVRGHAARLDHFQRPGGRGKLCVDEAEG